MISFVVEMKGTGRRILRSSLWSLPTVMPLNKCGNTTPNFHAFFFNISASALIPELKLEIRKALVTHWAIGGSLLLTATLKHPRSGSDPRHVLDQLATAYQALRANAFESVESRDTQPAVSEVKRWTTERFRKLG